MWAQDQRPPNSIRAVTIPSADVTLSFVQPGLVAAIERLLDSGRPLVVTVVAKGGGLIAAVKERPDIDLVQVTRENRDVLPEAFYRRLVAVLGSA